MPVSRSIRVTLGAVASATVNAPASPAPPAAGEPRQKWYRVMCLTGVDYFYVPDSETKDNHGFEKFVTFPGGDTASAANGGVLKADGTWSTTMVIPGATFAALDRGALEVYIPAYFKDYVTGKANDVEGFVAGTAEYMRQQSANAS